LLYRLRVGENCVVSVGCLLTGMPYPAFAVCDTDVWGMTLSQPLFKFLLDQSPVFRSFVFENFTNRISPVVGQPIRPAKQGAGQRLALSLLERGGLSPFDRNRLESIAFHGVSLG
jgi:CRP/FNR family transcriptional regulator